MRGTGRRGWIVVAAACLLAVLSGAAMGAQVWEFYAEDAAPPEDCAFDGCKTMAEEEQFQGGPVDLGSGESILWVANRTAGQTQDFSGATWILRLHCTEEITGDVETSLGRTEDPEGTTFTPVDTNTTNTERCEGEDSDLNLTYDPPSFSIAGDEHLALRVSSLGAVVDVHAKGEAPDTQLVYPEDTPDYPNATAEDDGSTDSSDGNETDDEDDGSGGDGADDGTQDTPLPAGAAALGLAGAAALRRRRS